MPSVTSASVGTPERRSASGAKATGRERTIACSPPALTFATLNCALRSSCIVTPGCVTTAFDGAEDVAGAPLTGAGAGGGGGGAAATAGCGACTTAGAAAGCGGAGWVTTADGDACLGAGFGAGLASGAFGGISGAAAAAIVPHVAVPSIVSSTRL